MITVFIASGIYSVTVIGHAGCGAKGEDPICGAASVLALTMAENVKTMEESQWLENKTIVLRNGYADIQFCPKEEYRKAAMLVYESVVTGFQILHDQFPSYVNCSRITVL